MSKAAAVKLSPVVKSLIGAPHALGSAIPKPAPEKVHALFEKIRVKGEQGGVGPDSWLTLSTGSLVTVNSPATLCSLFDYASSRSEGLQGKINAAAVIRETALKCISFSGIPRTINSLVALRAHLPEDVKSGLGTEPTRQPTPDNVEATLARGNGLWDAIYEPHSAKLLSKLSDAHPDLPVHILASHYSLLLSDPFGTSPPGGYKIGRVLTSVVAMACLRAQQGVAPQLTSHVFGLKKSLLEGGGAEGEQPVQGQEWLTSDDGVQWILESTDDISAVIGEGRSTFAGPTGVKAKL
ncbi:hypothetical protein I317_03309 [Kwoniella heveanensis CBS 569]|nr:hypothetical protein I317_03309 [Kwoniella heveanensis CBS 569]